MKKNKRKNVLFKSLSLVPFFCLPIVISSCTNSNNDNIKYNFQQSIFNQYNNFQIADLVKFAKIYTLTKNNQQQNYLTSNIHNNTITFKDLTQTYQAEFQKKPKTVRQTVDPKSLYVQYSKEEDQQNSFYLSEELEKKYKPNTFVPDLQLSIFSIILNKSNFNKAIPNWIDISAIRASSWVNNEEQKTYLENLLTVYLKAFDIKSSDNREFDKVKFTNLKNDDFSVTFNIDLLDKNGKLITPTPNKTTFFINRFLNYKTASPQRLNFVNRDKSVLFNEYINFPILSLKQNPYSFINSDNFVDGTFNIYNIYTAKAFASFVERFPQLFVISIPYEKRPVDEKYELTNKVEFAPFPSKTYEVLKLQVKVTKKNGDVVYYPWYSIDLNRHYHLFKGYLPKLKLDYGYDDLWSYSNLRFNKKPDYSTPAGIDPNTFYEKAILNIVSYVFWKERNNLVIWDNKKMIDSEAFEVLHNPQKSIKYIENDIANLVLTFLIGNKQNDFLSGIKDVKLEYVGYKNPGSLEIKVDFLGYNNESLLSPQNRQKTILVSYFKGANIQKIIQWTEANDDTKPLKLTNVPPLAKFKN